MRISGKMNDPKDNASERIVRLMQRDDSLDAPADAVRWAKNLFRTRSAEPRPSLVQRIVATLQTDLLPGKPAFGERSAAAGSARQMLFNAGENAVDIRITAMDANVQIQGQVLGEGFGAGEVVLSGRDFERKTAIGEMNEFAVDSVPRGYYKMVLRSDEKEIVIENVDI
jgi:hypothetical protein